eukprot:Gb_35921 [translate_table: standard]
MKPVNHTKSGSLLSSSAKIPGSPAAVFAFGEVRNFPMVLTPSIGLSGLPAATTASSVGRHTGYRHPIKEEAPFCSLLPTVIQFQMGEAFCSLLPVSIQFPKEEAPILPTTPNFY